jgi:hypothetical protein
VRAAVAASSADVLTDSMPRTWRSAPWATSPTADAISPTALPASPDVAAICCDADDTVPAFDDTSPISPLRFAAIAL